MLRFQPLSVHRLRRYVARQLRRDDIYRVAKTPQATSTPATRTPPDRLLRFGELLLFYFLVPVLPLFDVAPSLYGPLFGITAVVLTVLGLIERRRGTRAGGAAPDKAVRRLLSWPRDLPALATVFVLFAVVSTVVIWRFAPEQLFQAPREAPGLWLLFWLIYSLGSVAPQEGIFRVVFFQRYSLLWGGKRTPGVLINAASFSLAHALMGHPMVYLLTFGGGLIFAQHWLRERNFLSLCVLHSAYGLWLFTVGLGPVFGFPF